MTALWLMEELQDPKTLPELHEAFGGIAKVPTWTYSTRDSSPTSRLAFILVAGNAFVERLSIVRFRELVTVREDMETAV